MDTAQIVRDFEAVISEDPAAYGRVGEIVYQVTQKELIAFVVDRDAQQREAGRQESALDYGLLKLTLEQTQVRLAQADAAIESLATKPAEDLTDPEIEETWFKVAREWGAESPKHRHITYARAILAQQAKKGNSP